MRSVGKFLAVALAVLVLLCILGGLGLGYSERGKEIVRFTEGIFKISRTAKGVEGLAQKFPYTPPSDGNVPEERLLVYIAVCQQVKPAVRAYEDWVKVNEGKQGDFKDAQNVIKLTSDVMEGASKALDQNLMGPTEFGWIDRAINEAAKEQASSGTELEREMFESYSKVLDFPDLGRGERERVSKDLSKFKEKLGETGSAPLSLNAELYRRHATELKECDLGNGGRELLQGFMHGGRPRHRRVEAEKREK